MSYHVEGVGLESRMQTYSYTLTTPGQQKVPCKMALGLNHSHGGFAVTPGGTKPTPELFTWIQPKRSQNPNLGFSVRILP